MKLRSLVTGILVLAMLTIVVFASTVSVEYKDIMLEKGATVANLQNTYGQVYDDRVAYNTVFNSLSQYFDDEFDCLMWNSDLTWEFASEYVSGLGKDCVLWLGVNRDGKEEMYCFAVYDASTGLFSNLEQRYLFTSRQAGV